MKKYYTKNKLSLFAIIVVGVASIHSASGPATNLGQNVTGAPFDNGICTNCHGGGSFSPSVSLQLLSGSTPVTSYVPGASYTVRITRSASGNPAGFGFQMTCATGSGNTNYNGWGSALPANITNEPLGGRNYIEHIAMQPISTTQVNIPWTAPTAATLGNANFWIALNTVNGSGDPSGDHVTSTTMSIPISPTPVTWLYFRGKDVAEGALLEWATAREKNNSHFTIEKSNDGKNFESLATITSKKMVGKNEYSFLDKDPFANGFYRIAQVDIDGTPSYYNTIQLAVDSKRKTSSHFVEGNKIIIQLHQEKEIMTVTNIYDLSGRKITGKNSLLGDRDNTITMDKPQHSGLYILTVQSNNKIIYTGKVFVD